MVGTEVYSQGWSLDDVRWDRFEPSKVERAREHLAAGELTDLVEIRVGDALQTLRSGLPDAIDLVLLDGAKALYPQVLDLLESRLRPGALVVADNADDSPEYLARVRSVDSGYLSTPFGDDVDNALNFIRRQRSLLINLQLYVDPDHPDELLQFAEHRRSLSINDALFIIAGRQNSSIEIYRFYRTSIEGIL